MARRHGKRRRTSCSCRVLTRWRAQANAMLRVPSGRQTCAAYWHARLASMRRPCSFQSAGRPWPRSCARSAFFRPRLLAARHYRSSASAHRGRSFCPWASPLRVAALQGSPRRRQHRLLGPRGGRLNSRRRAVRVELRLGRAKAATHQSFHARSALARLGPQLLTHRPVDPNAGAQEQRGLRNE